MKLKPIHFAVLILLAASLGLGQSGCAVQNPNIDNILTEPTQIEAKENFKVFFTINNPTDRPTAPYIGIEYDSKNILSLDRPLMDGKRLQLSSIAPRDKRNYFLSFSSAYKAESGTHSIKIALYNKEDALEPLGSIVNAEITISESATK